MRTLRKNSPGQVEWNRVTEVLEEDIDDVNAQLGGLGIASGEEARFLLKVRGDIVHSAESAVQSLKECWSSLGKEYNALKEYCGGIASVMPATSSVESDFFVNWTRDPHSKS
jgi:hypothetical protein